VFQFGKEKLAGNDLLTIVFVVAVHDHNIASQE
jgi:hypothetical protein